MSRENPLEINHMINSSRQHHVTYSCRPERRFQANAATNAKAIDTY